MAIFSPYPTADNDPNYLGLSKEPQSLKPNIAMGKLFEGMGDMIEMGVKGLDTINKGNIEDELSSKLTSQRNAEIARAENTLKALNPGGADPSTQPLDPTVPAAAPLSFAETPTQQSNQPGDRTASPESPSSLGPMPRDLTVKMNTLTKMDEANAAGKFSSTQMQMNAQAIVSDVMQRYPGYRANITRVAESLGFGQKDYLRDLTTQINQAATRIDAKDTKDQAWENTNRAPIMILQPNYFNMPKDVRRSDAMRDRLQAQIGSYEARTTDAKDRITQLEVKEKEGADINKSLAETTTDAVNTMLAASLTGTSNVMGYKNVNAIQQDLNNQLSTGNAPDPAKATKMGLALEQFKQAHIAAALNYMRTTRIGNTTIAGKLGEDKTNEIAKNSVLAIETMQKAISEKNYTLAGAAAMEAQMRLDRTGLAISKAYPIVDNMKVLETKYGPQVTGLIIQNSPQSQAALTAPAQQLLTGGVMGIALGSTNPSTGQPMTVNDLYKDFKKLGVVDDKGKIDPNDAAAVMDHVKVNILKTPSKEMATTMAKGTFTSDLLARVPAKDKLGFLVNYANPEMTARVLDLGKSDPDLVNQYKMFLHTGVLAATQQTVSDFKTVQNSTSTAFSANKYYKMEFNPETNRVDLTMTPTESIYAELGQTASRYGSINAQLKVVRKTVADLNSSLTILDPVLKSEKSHISGEMLQLLQETGVKMPVKGADTGSPALRFTDDELPSSGNVGSLDSWTRNPAGNVAPVPQPPVVASGGQRTSSNLSDHPLLGMKVDNIPEGMSAREFLRRLQQTSPELNGEAHAKYRDQQ